MRRVGKTKGTFYKAAGTLTHVHIRAGSYFRINYATHRVSWNPNETNTLMKAVQKVN